MPTVPASGQNSEQTSCGGELVGHPAEQRPTGRRQWNKKMQGDRQCPTSPRVHNKFTRQARSITLCEQCLIYHGHTGHQHARWSPKTWPPSIGSAWACRRRPEETHVSQAHLLHERSTPHEQVAVEPRAMHPACACQWLSCACHLGPAPAVSLLDVIGGMKQGDSSHVVVATIPRDYGAGALSAMSPAAHYTEQHAVPTTLAAPVPPFPSGCAMVTAGCMQSEDRTRALPTYRMAQSRWSCWPCVLQRRSRCTPLNQQCLSHATHGHVVSMRGDQEERAWCKAGAGGKRKQRPKDSISIKVPEDA